MDNPNATILIVDDDAINRRLLEGILQPKAYQTMVACSGEETLRMVEQRAPDLILLDVMMPGMSGFEVAERLKADARFCNIPIIMVTALTDRESRLTALNNGAEEFLNKPIDRVELLIRVRNLLRLKKYQDFLANNFGILEEQLSERVEQLASAKVQLSATQEQLVESERLASIGHLAAGVAHEINNPMAFVNSNLGSLESYLRNIFRILDAYLAIEGAVPPEALAELHRLKSEIDLDYLRDDTLPLIGESRAGISRVRRIVTDLMEFSRPGGSQDWTPSDLHAGLDATVNLARSEIGPLVEVVKNYGAIPLVDGLPAKLNQVFLNLLVNAAHAMETNKPGRITLTTTVCGDEVRVDVSDTGSGISPEHLKHIFDPFFTTRAVGAGAGLGLSIVYGIVKQHGGRIEVDSFPGQGSTFSVVLPQRRA